MEGRIEGGLLQLDLRSQEGPVLTAATERDWASNTRVGWIGGQGMLQIGTDRVTLDDLVEARRQIRISFAVGLTAQGWSTRQIGAALGVAHTQVVRWLAAG